MQTGFPDSRFLERIKLERGFLILLVISWKVALKFQPSTLENITLGLGNWHYK